MLKIIATQQGAARHRLRYTTGPHAPTINRARVKQTRARLQLLITKESQKL